MKYVKKIPPTDKELSALLLKDGWKKIKESSNIFVVILLSIPFMVFNGLLSFLIIAQFNKFFVNAVTNYIHSGILSINIRLEYLLYAFIIIISHELIHVVFIPNFIKSKNTYFGIRPWGGFASTTERLGKSRFLLISIAPFIILSIILPVFLGLLNLLSGVIAFLVLLNAAASSVDILNGFLIFFQVPKGSFIINNGFETYYKKLV